MKNAKTVVKKSKAKVPVKPKTTRKAKPVEPKEPEVKVSGDEQSLMSEAEFEKLSDLEAVISDSWWEMGRSFGEIKSKKLYRQKKDGTRQTWEDYCREVHKLTKQYVDKVIQATGNRQTLKTETIVSVLPATVSQAAELSGLTREQMAAATEAAVKAAASQKRKVTAKDYANASAPFKEVKDAEAEAAKANGGEQPPQPKAILYKVMVVVSSENDLMVTYEALKGWQAIRNNSNKTRNVVAFARPNEIAALLQALGAILEAGLQDLRVSITQ